MLTRLQVNGFKNLVDVDVRFGPFTCIAGANGVGKSNLFDAIHFLSAIADRPLIDAALSVRDEGGRTGDLRSLFHRVGDDYDDEMSFVAEMIVPEEGVDDLGQPARASITFLRYAVTLAFRKDENFKSPGPLEIIKEELSHINQQDALRHLWFPHSATNWRKKAIKGRRGSHYFISTDDKDGSRRINLHQDGGSSGRPLPRSAANLPRTVLSIVNAAESPTALMARMEMRSWQLLQLEPSALREPDKYTAPTRIGMDGSHLAATLFRLGTELGEDASGSDYVEMLPSPIYDRVANRLSELIDDVREVSIDRDDKRELSTVQVMGRDRTVHPARALSDGTLRFLALAVIELDPEAQGVICLEEPENGIHPERIPAMLRLLRDIATDTDYPVGPDNPLRQVIINTHSPSVVMQVPDDSLLVAELRDTVRSGIHYKRVVFSGLPNTWRQKDTAQSDTKSTVSKGQLLAYLNPVQINGQANGDPDKQGNGSKRSGQSRSRRVVDREDLQMLLPFDPELDTHLNS